MGWKRTVAVILGLAIAIVILVYIAKMQMIQQQEEVLKWVESFENGTGVKAGNWTIVYNGGGYLTGNDSIIEVWTTPTYGMPYRFYFTYPFNPNDAYVIQYI
ncbi:MAG: hypothetical protein ACP5NQ_09800, partial [Vulcanisaeta sp.]